MSEPPVPLAFGQGNAVPLQCRGQLSGVFGLAPDQTPADPLREGLACLRSLPADGEQNTGPWSHPRPRIVGGCQAEMVAEPDVGLLAACPCAIKGDRGAGKGQRKRHDMSMVAGRISMLKGEP